MSDLQTFATALAGQSIGVEYQVPTGAWADAAFCTGALQVGFSPMVFRQKGLHASLAEHFAAIIAYDPSHPYAILGEQRALEYLSQFFKALGETFDASAPPQFGISATGRLVHGVLLQSHRTEMFFDAQKHFGIVQFSEDPHFAAQHVLAGLQHDARLWGLELPSCDIVTVALAESAHKNPLQIANLLDHRPEDFVDVITRASQGFTGLVMPPVLGLKNHSALRARFGFALVEALGHIPSAPGARFQYNLENRVHASNGVALLPKKHLVSSAHQGECHGISIVMGWHRGLQP
jgi:anaerobic glycerol-3-phosphate dehydrogenase